MEIRDECLKLKTFPVFEVVSFVSKDMLPSLKAGQDLLALRGWQLW